MALAHAENHIARLEREIAQRETLLADTALVARLPDNGARIAKKLAVLQAELATYLRGETQNPENDSQSNSLDAPVLPTPHPLGGPSTAGIVVPVNGPTAAAEEKLASGCYDAKFKVDDHVKRMFGMHSNDLQNEILAQRAVQVLDLDQTSVLLARKPAGK